MTPGRLHSIDADDLNSLMGKAPHNPEAVDPQFDDNGLVPGKWFTVNGVHSLAGTAGECRWTQINPDVISKNSTTFLVYLLFVHAFDFSACISNHRQSTAFFRLICMAGFPAVNRILSQIRDLYESEQHPALELSQQSRHRQGKEENELLSQRHAPRAGMIRVPIL